MWPPRWPSSRSPSRCWERSARRLVRHRAGAHLFDEGFERLAAAQRAVPEDLPPRERVVELCRAYRRLAHDFPHHYDLMLGARSGTFTPAPESRHRAIATIDYLAEVLQPLQPPGAGRKARAEDHAHVIIAFCRGWVT